MSFMVAIGHFAQPSVIELQAEVIRANCGADTPIMVCDDFTETAHDESKGVGPERGQRLKDRLLEICDRKKLIYRSSGDRRLGHIGGDLGPFWHGLHYARDNAIEYVCKLSQRLVIDRPNWLAELTRQMGKFQYATASRGCFYHQRGVFHMRTELVVMKTLPWLRPDVLADLQPRELPQATEHLIYQQIGKINRGPSNFFAPRWFPANRHEQIEGAVWKDALPREETDRRYAALFEKYGVVPGEEFNASHSCLQIGYKVGLLGR